MEATTYGTHAARFTFAAAALVAPPILAGQEGAIAVDPSAVEAAALVLQARPQDSDWEGFTAPTEFLVCTAEGGTLYALSEPPQLSPGLASLASPAFEGLYYSSTRPAGLEERCFQFDFVFEGRPMLSFPQIDSIYSVSDPVEALAVALVHEEFHRFQRESFGLMNGPDDRVYHILEKAVSFPDTLVASSTFRRSAAEERRVLADAIGESDTIQVLRLARRYVALRSRRLERVPEELRFGEAHVEWKEGTAHLASYSLVMKLTASPDSRVADLIHSDLLSTPAFDHNPHQFRHWHIYATGAGIGLVLDKLGVSWRREVQEGESLFDRLRVVTATPDSKMSVPNKR